jgi:hypothetical protein
MMATFKVGQRVRYTSGHLEKVPLHAEGVVVAAGVGGGAEFCDCDFPGAQADFNNVPGRARVHHTSIVPLTDPKADAFIESIKRLKPYEKPKVTKVTA